MYSKVKLFGHPIHPMLVAYPIALYTATLVAFIIAAARGDTFWFRVAVVANIGGVIMAVVTALPGFIDWALGIPTGTPAKDHGLRHMLLNVIALVLFIINAAVHASQWYATHPDRGWGIALSLVGVLCTVGAGIFGWTLIQTDYVGVELSPDQTRHSTVGRRGVT
jgi:uncharacterized membrane protein